MNQTQKQETPQAAYFKSLTLENVKCFKEKQTIDFSENGQKPAQWTVILGNNNTGKTTILTSIITSFITQINAEGYNYVINLNLHEKLSDLDMSNITNIEKYYDEEYRTFEYSQIELFYGCSLNRDCYFKSEKFSLRKFLKLKAEEREKFIPVKFAYGVTRKIGKNNLTEESHGMESLVFGKELIDVEDWLIQLHLTSQKVEKAKIQLEKVKRVLTTGLLPDVQEITFFTEQESPFRTFIRFKTDYGEISLKDLGYGYQTMLSWVLDFVKRMFERYPNEENPLTMPAVVLVDEIDLHLHPDWQRKIIAFLSHHFPNTQFIVTAHSPLIVQSAESINVVLLEKIKDHVIIKQPQIKTFKGWTIEEILSELMGLEDKTLSDSYLALMKQFDEGLDEDDFEKAEHAYHELDKILHPESTQRKLLRLQMSSLIPA